MVQTSFATLPDGLQMMALFDQAFAKCASVSTSNIDVFTIAGQSNAVGDANGQGGASPTVPTGQVLQVNGAAISDANDPIGTLTPNGISNGSAWPMFGIYYCAATNRKIAFVPTAIGGSAQEVAADTGNGNWDTTGALAAQSISLTQQALATLTTAGYAPTFRGYLWCQGEADAASINNSTGGTQAGYLAALTTMVGRYRAVFGPNMPLYMFRIATSTSQSDVGYAQIRAAQSSYVFGDPNSFMVTYGQVDYPTIGYMGTDGLHYTQPGYNLMGRTGAASVIAALSKEPYTWTVNNFFAGQSTFNPVTTIASATSATLDDVVVATDITTITGTTNITTAKGFNKVSLYRPTITDSSSVTINKSSTLYIDNAPLASGSVTITQPWALNVGAGCVFVQGTNETTTITDGQGNVDNSSFFIQRVVTNLATTWNAVVVDVQNNNTSASQVLHGAAVYLTTPSSNSTAQNRMNAILGSVQYGGTGGLSSAIGDNFTVGNVGTGTITTSTGLQTQLINTGGGTNTLSNEIRLLTPVGATTGLTSVWTNISAIEIQDMNPTGAGTNTLTNPPVAILIDSQTATGAFALKQVGSGLNSFAGATTFTLNRGLQFSGQSSTAAAQTATLTNSPASGNPSFWLPVIVNGVNYSMPLWAG